MPKRMSQPVTAKVVERIAEHAEKHGLASVEIILHGGEPLLAGAEWLTKLAKALHSQVPAHVNIAVQTNGTLLNRPMLETLKRLGISIGVSLDGDAEATGLHRRYADGRNSFDAVANALYFLQSAEFRECYSGILCTIDTRNDPVATYEALLKFRPPTLDLLLPHANWSSPPPGDGYADWLISVFERWYSAPRQETRIRLFSELIQLVLGQPGAVEGLGLLPSTLVVVDTDGSIKQLDSLSSTYPGAAYTGLHVAHSSFDEALSHPTTVARQIGIEALSPQCRACKMMEICGGGLYPHRYRSGAGFRNPSVYCEDLQRLITHVRDRVIADLSRLNALQSRAIPVKCNGGQLMTQSSFGNRAIYRLPRPLHGCTPTLYDLGRIDKCVEDCFQTSEIAIKVIAGNRRLEAASILAALEQHRSTVGAEDFKRTREIEVSVHAENNAKLLTLSISTREVLLTVEDEDPYAASGLFGELKKILGRTQQVGFQSKARRRSLRARLLGVFRPPATNRIIVEDGAKATRIDVIGYITMFVTIGLLIVGILAL